MGIQINGTTNNINAGIGSLSIEDIKELDITGVATASNFKSGTSNVHSTGYECTNVNATGVITATSFVGSGANLTGITQTTINNNTNDYILTGTGTANTINGEANLTFNGNNLYFNTTANGHAVIIKSTGNFYNKLSFDSGNTSAGGELAYVDFKWDGDKVADILALAGSDATNKDDGQLVFRTSPSQGSISERLRITQSGNIGINETSPQQLLHVHNDTNYQGILINGNVAPRIAFARSTTTTGEWSVGIDGTNGNNFAINNSNDNSNNKIVISSSQVSLYGHVGVPNGNIIMGSTRGIDFSATSDASLMQYAGTGADPSTDSEVLTDYEHGTWTPRIRAYDHTGNAGWGTLKYTDGTDVTGVGRYVKVGNHVWAGFKIESGSKTFDSNWTYFSIDSTPYGANNYDKASGSLYVSQTNFFTDSNSHIGGFVHGGESYMVVNKPNGHSNAQLNTSNNNRYCYGHISIYSSRY